MRSILVLLLSFVSVPNRAETADVFSLLISSRDTLRIQGASQLSKMSYEELKDFDLGKTECAKLSEEFDPRCRYMNHAVYHLIGVYRKWAQKEMDPKSTYFCQKQDTQPCPFLSKLRWLVSNQFENPLVDESDLPPKSKHVTERNLQKIAFQALSEVTDVKFKTLKDLQSFRVKSTEDDGAVWSFVQFKTSDGMYPAPIIFGLKYDKGKSDFTVIKKSFPFRPSKDFGYEYAPDSLRTIADLDDVILFPGRKIAVVRKNGGMGGDDRLHLYFLDLESNFAAKQHLTVSNYDAFIPDSTIEVLHFCVGSSELQFPLKEMSAEKTKKGRRLVCELKSLRD